MTSMTKLCKSSIKSQGVYVLLYAIAQALIQLMKL